MKGTRLGRGQSEEGYKRQYNEAEKRLQETKDALLQSSGLTGQEVKSLKQQFVERRKYVEALKEEMQSLGISPCRIASRNRWTSRS